MSWNSLSRDHSLRIRSMKREEEKGKQKRMAKKGSKTTVGNAFMIERSFSRSGTSD